jgi:ABC-type multidrug transport system fused ATPase/permease subunit
VVIGVWAVNISSRLRPVWLRVQQAMGDLGTVLQENLTGIRVVQAFCQEEAQQELYDRCNRRLRELSLRASRIGAFHQPFLLFMLNLAVAATLWVGGREVMAGRLTLGELVAFTQYLLMLFMPVRALGWVMNIFARAQSAGERIFEILDSVGEVPEKPNAVELKDVRGEVVFENVTFAYSERAPALRNVNLRVRPGEVVALVGPTGSGKSTLVQLIPRFYDVTSGRVLIDGYDVRDLKLASLRRNIGIVLQDTFLFAATIRENIAYGRPDTTDEEVIAAARAARIHDFIMSLPDGYNTWVGERGLTLSGGQRQRVAIARVLLLDPKILILDDALSSVDVETEAEIQAALETVMRGRTTFVVAHRLKTARLAHRVIVMVGGEIVEEGTHDELVARNGFYRQIYETQLRPQEDAGLLVRGDD